MRQDDRVRLGMRQAEGAAEHVAELVVQGHADRAQAGAAQPCAVEGLGARLAILWIRTIRGSARARAAMPSSAISEITGFRSLAIECFDRVGDGVHARGRRGGDGQAQRQVDVVDDDSGRILGSRRVVFAPSFVSPRIGVISEPA